jgi:hypothetical protein
VKSSVLMDKMPYSPLEVSRCFGGMCCLHLLCGTNFMLVYSLPYVSTLKIEALCVVLCAVFSLNVLCYVV